LPNATLRLLEGCGHAPAIERPEQFVDLVREFLGVASAGMREGTGR
jgi:pimeloyl-ACP methyl ester carboxylesterase